MKKLHGTFPASGSPSLGLCPLPPISLPRLPLTFRFSAKLFGIDHLVTSTKPTARGLKKQEPATRFRAREKEASDSHLTLAATVCEDTTKMMPVAITMNRKHRTIDQCSHMSLASSEKLNAGPSIRCGGSGERHHQPRLPRKLRKEVYNFATTRPKQASFQMPSAQ